MFRSTYSRRSRTAFVALLAALLVGWMQLAVAGHFRSMQVTEGVGQAVVDPAMGHVPCPHAFKGSQGQTDPHDGRPFDGDCSSCPLCQALRFVGILPILYVLIGLLRVASRPIDEIDSGTIIPRTPVFSSQPRAPPIWI